MMRDRWYERTGKHWAGVETKCDDPLTPCNIVGKLADGSLQMSNRTNVWAITHANGRYTEPLYSIGIPPVGAAEEFNLLIGGQLLH